MVKQEIDDVFDYLINSYGKSFEFNDNIYRFWSKELSQYEYNDIMGKLRTLMSEERYSMKAPLLEAIIRGIPKTSEKVNFNELTYFCQFCHRAYNDYSKLVEHEDRCRSIRYIERQCKKYAWGGINKRELYEMEQAEFDARYKKFLRKVQTTTRNGKEKNVIESIFTPTSSEMAIKIINGGV